MAAMLFAAICFIGFAASLVRLALLLRPEPSISCKAKWWAWVAIHIGLVVGFAAGVMDAGRDWVTPPFSAWLIRLSVVGLLVLMSVHRRRPAK